MAAPRRGRLGFSNGVVGTAIGTSGDGSQATSGL
jgi:hypothetical protein